MNLRPGFRLATAAVLGVGTVGLGATAAHAASATLFVNGSASCSDTTSDSGVTPFCHIGPAVAQVAPGQTVQIAAGVYLEPPIDIKTQGTAASPVAITAAPGAHVQIGSPNQSPSVKEGVVFDHAAYVTLNGVTVYGVGSDAAIAVNSSSHVSVTGVVADTGLHAGVHVTGSDSTVVARSWLSDQNGPSTDNGIIVDGGSTATTITADASAAALRAVWIDGATGTAVTGTTSQYACVAGLEVDNSSTGTAAENNIFSNDDAVAGSDSVTQCGTATPDPNHGDIAVAADSLTGSHFDYNLLDSSLSPGSTTYRWGSQTFATEADFHTNTGQGAKDLISPVQLSSDDVPLEGSPAIDSADSDAIGEQSTDLAGHPRVADLTLTQTGTGVRDYDDRGAFEFQDPFAPTLSSTQTGTFSATLTAGTTGWHPAASYTFDFGNGDTVTQSSPTINHTFPVPINLQPGEQQYTVKVTATEAGTGTTATVSRDIGFWYEPPIPNLVTSAPLAADGKSYTLIADASSTVAGSEPIKSYTFHVVRTDTPNRPFDVTVTQASPIYTLPDALEGVYTITVTATDSLGVTGTMLVPQSVTQAVSFRPAGAVTVHRVSGSDRYATAVAVSQQTWADASSPADGTGRKSANAVVLATGEGFADAVAGVPLAAKTGGPLLLTAPTALTSETAAEITRVLPAHQGKTVYVLGGVNAVSEPVAAKIRALGYTVVRFGGTDRFATALDIAEREFPNAGHVFVATGRAFPDALAAGPLAATQGAPIVLSDGPALDAATASYLRAHAAPGSGSGTVTAVGGDADRALSALGGGAVPHVGLVGRDRYETAAAVAAAFPQQVHTTHVGIATGEQFADALTGGAMMASLGQPLLLTTSDTLSSPDYTALYGWMELKAVSVFGGPAAVSDTTVNQIVAQVRGSLG